MKILFFAQARQVTGLDFIDWEVTTPQSSEALWNWLLEQHPSLTPLRASSRLARNEEYLRTEELFQPTDVVAVIPPVSGG